MTPINSWLAAGALAFCVAAAITSTQAADTTVFDATYRVLLDGRDVGQFEVEMAGQGATARITALTIPGGVARLLAKKVTESFTYEMSGERWRPIEYSEAEGGSDPFEMHFEHGEELVAINGAESSRHPADSLVEPQGFPLASYLLPPESLDKLVVLTLSDRGIRSYRYTLVGKERVSIGEKTYDTLKWLKQRPDRDSRGFYIWTDASTRMPVRVEKFRKGQTMTMELTLRTLKPTD